jgi:hypothetical protein
MLSPKSALQICSCGSLPALRRLDPLQGLCSNSSIMNIIRTQRLLAVFASVCLLLSLSLQSTARAQMDAQMMSMPVSQMAQMDSTDHCGGCDGCHTLLTDCGTCASVPAVLDSAGVRLRLLPAMLRAPQIHFHASLSPAPEPQPPRQSLIV